MTKCDCHKIIGPGSTGGYLNKIKEYERKEALEIADKLLDKKKEKREMTFRFLSVNDAGGIDANELDYSIEEFVEIYRDKLQTEDDINIHDFIKVVEEETRVAEALGDLIETGHLKSNPELTEEEIKEMKSLIVDTKIFIEEVRKILNKEGGDLKEVTKKLDEIIRDQNKGPYTQKFPFK